MINPQTGKDEKCALCGKDGHFAMNCKKESNHMGKWNFDFIFTGTLDEQGEKAKAFLTGADDLEKQIHQQFARAFLTGESPGGRWEELRDLRAVQVAFCEDPRTIDILRQKTAQKFGEVGMQAVDRLFKSVREAARRERENR